MAAATGGLRSSRQQRSWCPQTWVPESSLRARARLRRDESDTYRARAEIRPIAKEVNRIRQHRPGEPISQERDNRTAVWPRTGDALRRLSPAIASTEAVRDREGRFMSSESDGVRWLRSP